MDADLDRIQEAVSRRRGRTEKLSAELQSLVARYVGRERARSERTWQSLAEATGLSVSTLHRVIASVPQHFERTLVPVRVEREAAAAPPPAGAVVVTPSGYRVEGLSVADAAELVRLVG